MSEQQKTAQEGQSRRPRETGHERIDHKFTYPIFDYDEPIKYQPCIKVMHFFRKLPEVSHEHFFKHYGHVHSDLTVACKAFGVYKIERYTQHHQTPDMKEKLQEMGRQVLPFDACSTLWVRSWEDLDNFSKSPEFAKFLVPDGFEFIDKSTFTLFAGHEMIAYGGGVPGVDDSGGVPRGQSGVGNIEQRI